MKIDDTQNSIVGTILEIQRMSTEDGPGLRTTLFIKGCTLKCAWCHNPESISSRPQVHWIESKCIGCGMCIEACPEHALSSVPEGIVIDRNLCKGCGMCAEECPSTAMELLGEKWKVEDIIDELIKDRAYFEKSNNGGVTLSGGEVTVQYKFASAVLQGLKERGIQTAIDTCGQCRRESLDELLPYSDLVLFDIKEIDPERHKQFTGSSNQGILENLIYVSKFIEKHLYPRELWIRTPVIPDATDRKENIAGIGRFIAEHADKVVTRWELCSFNNLCRDKYMRLGMDWPFKDSSLMSSEDMARLAGVARDSGVNPGIVHWSGSTRLQEDGKNVNKEELERLRLIKKANVCN